MPYIPTGFRGGDIVELAKWVEQELEAIAQQSAESSTVELRTIHSAPSKPREGMLVFADGTDWNPGAGKGVYTFSGTAWVKL